MFVIVRETREPGKFNIALAGDPRIVGSIRLVRATPVGTFPPGPWRWKDANKDGVAVTGPQATGCLDPEVSKSWSDQTAAAHAWMQATGPIIPPNPRFPNFIAVGEEFYWYQTDELTWAPERVVFWELDVPDDLKPEFIRALAAKRGPDSEPLSFRWGVD
jgi:hypothetical protein